MRNTKETTNDDLSSHHITKRRNRNPTRLRNNDHKILIHLTLPHCAFSRRRKAETPKRFDRAIMPKQKETKMAYSTFCKKYQSQKYVRSTIRRAQARYGKFSFLNAAQ